MRDLVKIPEKYYGGGLRKIMRAFHQPFKARMRGKLYRLS
jgi:hypothetical protein